MVLKSNPEMTGHRPVATTSAKPLAVLAPTPQSNQALFFEAPMFLHCALSCANCSAERIPLAWVRNVSRLCFVQPALTHWACHVSILVFWSDVRFNEAKLTHATECALAAPLAQHAWSPANALDAASIAVATKAIALILIIVRIR